MSSLLHLVTCLLLIGACSCTYGGGRPQEGDPCTPRSLKRCGDPMLVDETVTALSEDDGFGPNLCQTIKVYETETYSYAYQHQCQFGRFCTLKCKRTDSCEGDLVNITKTEVDCCEGFAEDPSLRRNGCPIMLRDSVLDCLLDLDLTAVLLSELENVTEFLINLTNERSYTFFAPSNEAFDAFSDVERPSSWMILGGHIVNGSKPIFTNRLQQGQILTPIDDQYSLHVTTVSSRSDRDVYLNGARISDTAVCQARNVIVYVMDSVIPLSNQTIAEVLDSQDRFSVFSNLLNVSGIDSHLQKNEISCTIFAPTNDSFDKLPSEALERLLQEGNEKSLQQFVYNHISYPTEYSSTLSQRKCVQTSCPNYWLVITAEDESISVTRDMITIEGLDIPASNGVIHAIPEPIVVEKFCPDMLPAPCSYQERSQ